MSDRPISARKQSNATVELRDLQITTLIGTYGSGDVVPEAHILDLTLEISPDHVWVNNDAMALVFDYDPLIADIDWIAQEHHYETQEYLMSRIVDACAAYPQIIALDIYLHKRPVRGGTGTLGVRLQLGPEALAQHRARPD
ncbi:MAG: dihydroneopterin aldolase [Rhodobacteraceae bacterium]|nr:MAG: dihydroneopterin aldolase [Paracoccaceae bacterium]